jgi:hypothetical protein
VKKIIKFILLILFTYFSIGAYVLIEHIPLYLFPSVELKSEKTEELNKFSFHDLSNNELLVREYGQSDTQCLIFLPGQHAGINHYEKEMFSMFLRNGFKVFSISYPGQDGARGQVVTIYSLTSLISKAIQAISLTCPANYPIVYGRSLGATVAAFSVSNVNVSGLILEGASPSLSIAISNHLKSKWYLRPLALLPISMLLPNNYVLGEALNTLNDTPVVIFQGDSDIKTPLNQLQKSWNYHHNITLRVVKNSDHSNVYIKAKNDIITVATSMVGSHN